MFSNAYLTVENYHCLLNGRILFSDYSRAANELQGRKRLYYLSCCRYSGGSIKPFPYLCQTQFATRHPSFVLSNCKLIMPLSATVSCVFTYNLYEPKLDAFFKFVSFTMHTFVIRIFLRFNHVTTVYSALN